MSTDTPRDRYAQCDDACTVDCGACKGAGRPSPLTPPEVREAAKAVQDVAEALAACHLSGKPYKPQPSGPPRVDWSEFAAAAVAAHRATQDGGAEETLRDALRVHHPIMRSETGPFSGCRCGQVKLGQDVIGHVTGYLRAALAPQAGERPVCVHGHAEDDAHVCRASR